MTAPHRDRSSDCKPKPPPTLDETRLHLEDLMRRITAAINAHSFNPNEDPWTLLSPTFSVARSTVARDAVTSKAESLEGWASMVTAHPKFNVSLFSDMTTTIHDKQGKAEIYVDLISTGGPGIAEGMGRSAISVFCFERDPVDVWKWWVTREETLLGPGVHIA